MGWRKWLGLKPRIGDFARLLLDEFRRRGADGWIYDPANSTLRRDGGGQINLVNIFVEYSQAPDAQRRNLIEKYASFCETQRKAVPTLWELAAKSIYPVVRSQYDRTVTAITMRGEPGESKLDPVRWPYIRDLEIRIAYDWGMHLSIVSMEVAEAWGQSDEAIRERALFNLAALPTPIWKDIGSGVFELTTDTSYQESLFLVEKVVDQLRFNGPVVCSPCNRGILLAADSDNPGAVVALIEEARRNIEQKPWPLTGILLIRHPGSWEHYVPEGIARTKAEDLQRISQYITYRDQKEVLDEYHQKRGIDIHVATFSLFKRPQDGGALKSWCSWADGIPSLLPQTDFVALAEAKAEGLLKPILLEWDTVVTLLSPYMKATGDQPERFAVSEKLTASDWEALVSRGIAASESR